MDDLVAFGKAVGDARIVALGEASHGTREFFQMKHRLLEYLVKEKGFTVFASEANWRESLAVDRYVKTGPGDPSRAVGNVLLEWNTEEVLAMIEWMRAYNQAAGRPLLTFTSFDMQTPTVAAQRVVEYLRTTLPPEAATIETVEQAQKIVGLFDARRAELVERSSPAAWRDARQAADIVRQALTLRAKAASPGYRDEMMARNVEWCAGWAPGSAGATAARCACSASPSAAAKGERWEWNRADAPAWPFTPRPCRRKGLAMPSSTAPVGPSGFWPDDLGSR